MFVSCDIMNAPAPITGGISCDPREAVASIAPAVLLFHPSFFIIGIVMEPADTTLLTVLPDVIPRKQLDKIDTCAQPPLNLLPK